MSSETPLATMQTLSMIYNLSGQTGAVEAPMVVDISELLVSIGAIQVQEASDRTKLSVLLHETRDTLRPQMFEWAAAGFTPIYIVQKFELNPPSICSDGIQRNTLSYIEYLLGKDISQIIADIQALCLGVTISYSVSGNTLNIHVSRA
jgi:hypothetical protein